jgi:hypothetical protein
MNHAPPSLAVETTLDSTTALPLRAVLLIESDPCARAAMTTRCRALGLSVLAVDSIARVERWPAGQIVITDVAHLTPWWLMVGASHVVVIADSRDEARVAMGCGATTWMLRRDSESLGTLILLLGLGSQAAAHFQT